MSISINIKDKNAFRNAQNNLNIIEEKEGTGVYIVQ